jgi:hypothetical protein
MTGSNGTGLRQGRNAETPDMAVLGRTGLITWGGRIYEEWLPELRGTWWRRTVREMVDNDPTTGAVLFAVEMLMRQVSWRNQAADESAQAQKLRDFADSVLLEGDMSASWANTLSEIVTFLPWGWAWLEILIKQRSGWSEDPTKRSKHEDGLYAVRKLSLRAQDSLYRWDLDDEGGVQAMVQQVLGDPEQHTIPIQKSLLFRTTARRANPEGRSCLRNSWRPWVFKKRFEVIEGIGVERDAAGMPIARVPSSIMADDASPADKALYQLIQDQVTAIRRDEREGLVWPSDRDESGNLMYDVELLRAAGGRQIDIGAIIDRKKQEQAMTTLADVILLGHEKVGSFALASSKTNLLSYALGAWLDEVGDVITTHLYPRLARWNGFDPRLMPKLVHGDVESVDLAELGDYIAKLAGAGAPLFNGDPQQELYKHVLAQAGLPEPAPDEEPLPQVEPAEGGGQPNGQGQDLGNQGAEQPEADGTAPGGQGRQSPQPASSAATAG